MRLNRICRPVRYEPSFVTASPPSPDSVAPLPEEAEVVVVGAGLAGLAAARVLHRAGRDVVVLEASDGVGGRVRTDEIDGHRLDRGFQVLLTAYPELDRQLDVAALRLRRFEPGGLVWLGDRLHLLGDPLRRPRTLPSSATAPVGSLLDKARILRQRLRLTRTPAPDLLRGDDIPTIDALRDEGFSEAMVERFFRPLVGGIQLDPSLSTSRRMFDVVLKSLLTGDAAVPADGMGAIPAQMAAALPPDTIRLHSPVTSIEAGAVIVAGGRRVKAERVVVATEGPVAAELLDLPTVGSNPATCVWFATPSPPSCDGFIVLDGTGHGPALNVAVMSEVAPSYAPTGSSVIAAACPGVFDPDAETAVRRQLRSIWGDGVDRWRHLRTDTISHGQPDQRPPFSPKQRVALGDGLFVCGDHRDTGSIQGALYSGRRCGEAVLAGLT